MLAFCLSTKDGGETYLSLQVSSKRPRLAIIMGHNACSERMSRGHQNIFAALELLLTWFDNGLTEGEGVLPVVDPHCLVRRAHSGAQSLSDCRARSPSGRQAGAVWSVSGQCLVGLQKNTHTSSTIKQNKPLLQVSILLSFDFFFVSL